MSIVPTDPQALREHVRAEYAAAAAQATCCTAAETAQAACCTTAEAPPSCSAYPVELTTDLPAGAVRASLGSGDPVTAAQLRPGERVLDLGSGGGIDVLLAARAVGPAGRVHGVDMTPEMVALARRNVAEAGATNVEIHEGLIERLPLPDAAVDVVVSNCVINLAVDKVAVLREAYRVLAPGGRLVVSDIVAEDHLDAAQRAERGDYTGCIAGALSRREYLDGLAAAGFVDASVTFTHDVVDGMHGAIVRAVKPRPDDGAA